MNENFDKLMMKHRQYLKYCKNKLIIASLLHLL